MLLSQLFVNMVKTDNVLFFVGMGTWIQYCLTFTIVQLYFQKKQSIASGIVSCGTSIGIISGPIVTQLLLDHFGLRGCILIQAGLLSQCFICSLLYRPPQRDKASNNKNDEEQASNIIQRTHDENGNLKNRKKCFDTYKSHLIPFSVFVVGFFFVSMTDLYVVLFIPIRGEGMGISPRKSALLVTVIGVMGGICRPFTGFIANASFFKRRRPILYGVAAMLFGTLLLVSVSFTSFTSMVILTASYGLLSGNDHRCPMKGIILYHTPNNYDLVIAIE